MYKSFQISRTHLLNQQIERKMNDRKDKEKKVPATVKKIRFESLIPKK